MTRRSVFPFTAVVGQDDIKNALIWNIVNPLIGGLLISGEKGTAKSTLVRGAAAIAEGVEIVEAPLGVTEDRLVGAPDFEAAIKDGRREINRGLLSEADGNILYVDEINLLDDGIADAIISAAGNGVNIVEREGISARQSCRFILIGSMNPEEGGLRSHLLDRFGLYVEAKGCRELQTRVAIMEERLKYEKSPEEYIAAHAQETLRLRAAVSAAKKALASVVVTENSIRLASAMAQEARALGHRGELALIETARAIAALGGRRAINVEDLKEAARFALPHRTAAGEEACPPPPARGEGRPEECEDRRNETERGRDQEQVNENGGELAAGAGRETEEDRQRRGEGEKDGDELQRSGDPFALNTWEAPRASRIPRAAGSGRREKIVSKNGQGRYVRCRRPANGEEWDIAVDATIRAAAPKQSARGRGNGPVAIEREDVRVKIREKKRGGCIIFVVDASASMGVNRRMGEVKAAILSLLSLSYQKRDRVAMIAFRGSGAEIVLGVTSSVELAKKRLEILPTGGKTPLASGLELARRLALGLMAKEPEVAPEIVLISDGRANGVKINGAGPFDEALLAAERIAAAGIRSVVIDTENDFIKFHLCDKLNEKLNGTVIPMEELRAGGIVETVRTLARASGTGSR